MQYLYLISIVDVNISVLLSSVKESGLSFTEMFEEIPTVIKNSHLINASLCEIENMQPSTNKFNYMDLSTG